ncbi:uncharacterized protein LOC127122229 [Lathyrus oleraceus]|uniref:uncharacterized protein LOC127122229 n=1 Tax=Pisum sativum TaxID=3888 RepID=UPI0021D08638|nr:uncharacterized protein LOC127122229 [Pisum sativum]
MMLEVTPKKDNLPRSFYDEKRLVSKLGLEVRKTGYCISGCMLFMIMSLVLMIKRSRNVISGNKPINNGVFVKKVTDGCEDKLYSVVTHIYELWHKIDKKYNTVKIRMDKSICYNTDEWELINKYAKRFVKTGVKLRQTSFETWMGFAAKRDEPCKLMFAMELAEMLSTDMQKEGLHGRTLTLKLKTTSFEVRNRAVTLQNYINSSEDILKHASKLLKAELPVSVRLIGLRVSQFNGDKSGSGATPDRTQKTITNFITSGEANRKKDPFSDVTDHDFISDIETDPSIDVGHTSQLDSRDPFDGNHSLDVNHQSCTLWKNDGAEKVQTSGNDAASSHHSACTEMLGSTSFQGKFEGKNVIGLCFFSQDQKHRINRQSKSKKQKLSQREGRYTPIDYFFVKE